MCTDFRLHAPRGYSINAYATEVLFLFEVRGTAMLIRSLINEDQNNVSS